MVQQMHFKLISLAVCEDDINEAKNSAATLQPVQNISQAAWPRLRRYESHISLQGVSGLLLTLFPDVEIERQVPLHIQTQLRCRLSKLQSLGGTWGPNSY